MRLLSLCSGYGGLDLAVESVLGAETVAYAEVDKKAASVFARHWPGVPNLGDLTAVDWGELEDIDMVCAGFPCQDLSYAGKGAGIVKDSRSGLWYAIEHALGVLRPRRIVLENVAAIVGRRPGLDIVLAGLARLGFDAEWTCLRAADVGAPHGRSRWFLVARDAERAPADARAARRGPRHPTREPSRRVAADAGGERHGAGVHPRRVGRLDAADAGATRQRQWARQEPRDRSAATSADAERAGGAWRGRCGPADHGESPANAHVAGLERREPAPGRVMPAGGGTWGDYGPAIHRWEAILGRPAPPPTDERGQLSPLLVEWMMGLPQGWVTDTPGLSRADMLKILGNGVVPQQAAAAISALLQAREVAA